MEITKQQIIHTDVLIIGGGTAGCYAALTIREKSDVKIVIAEKANIKRSGCLAAGVNAINAYIVKGRKPQDYVDYARKDADEIVRGDLLLTMSEHLNEVTSKMEQLMRSVPRKYFVQQEGQQGFISQIIQDFQDIRCGIHHLTLVPDTQWELMLELR